MNRIKTNEVLNRLVAIHSRSLPMYLSDARPWTQHANDPARDALRHIAEDQRATIERLGEMILDHGGTVGWGEFPMSFTGKHDLSLDFLLKDLVDHQRQDVQAIEECTQHLEHDPLARATVEEVLGEAKGHLETLLELTQDRESAASQG